MYSISAPFIISSLLALSVGAAPQAPPPASSSTLALSVSAVPQAPPPASPPDACGPTNQILSDPKDSCSAPPPTVTSAASFGVLSSIGESNVRGGKAHSYDWEMCNPVLDLICTQMFAPNTTTGKWNFATGPATDSTGGPSAPCQMGFWLPNGDGVAGKAGTITSSKMPFDPLKPQGQCRNIFQTMLDVAASLNPTSLGSSVNLVTNPGSAAGSFKLPGGSGTGSAFNAAYPSYVLAYDSDWSPPTSACRDSGGALCLCGPLGTCAAPAGSPPGVDPLPCVDTSNGQPCQCGTSFNCRPPKYPPQQNSPQNPHPHPEGPVCFDSQTHQVCTCKSSPTCASGSPMESPS